VLPANDNVVVAPLGLLRLPARDAAEGAVPALDVQVFIQDHHAVGAVVQDGGQPLALLVGELVHARVVHGDGGLVGEALQQAVVVLSGRAGVGSKDEQDAEHVVGDDHGQGDHLAQVQVDHTRDTPHLGLQQRQVKLTGRARAEIF